jgi:hypothetical protein
LPSAGGRGSTFSGDGCENPASVPVSRIHDANLSEKATPCAGSVLLAVELGRRRIGGEVDLHRHASMRSCTWARPAADGRAPGVATAPPAGKAILDLALRASRSI